MADGASELVVDLPQVLPQPPDVEKEGSVPGTTLVPCTPVGVPTCRRNQALLNFQSPQGTRLQIRRIHVDLPVWLEEHVAHLWTGSSEERTEYKTEAEAQEALEGKGGIITRAQSSPPFTIADGKTITVTKTTYERAGKVVTRTSVIEVERTVLPITVQVYMGIVGPEGEIWSQSFDAPINFFNGLFGRSQGNGLINSYADLTNPLEIDPSKLYGLAIAIFVPSETTKTNTQLGLEIPASGTVVKGSNSAVTLFYDIENVPVGK